MKLANLIDRLLKIQNEYNCDDLEVNIMMEHMVNVGLERKKMQFESVTTDVAVCTSYDKGTYTGISKIIIIGQELD